MTATIKWIMLTLVAMRGRSKNHPEITDETKVYIEVGGVLRQVQGIHKLEREQGRCIVFEAGVEVED